MTGELQTEPGKVLIIGAGNVGTQAATMAVGMGARVVMLDRNRAALQRAQQLLGFRVETCLSSPEVIRRHLPDTDLVVERFITHVVTMTLLTGVSMGMWQECVANG